MTAAAPGALIVPPIRPMLARLARELPAYGFLYEPKWDGFRCIAFRSGDEVELRSRNDRPLARYFPEVVDGLRSLAQSRFVLDGELVVPTPGASTSECCCRGCTRRRRASSASDARRPPP
jgi:ATP-dependent DNA ligase